MQTPSPSITFPRLVWHIEPTYLGRPEPPFYRRCFFSYFFSPRILQVPSTDRPETLPHGRNVAEFHNPTPKIRGRSPKKIWGQKHAKFRSILDHFRL